MMTTNAAERNSERGGAAERGFVGVLAFWFLLVPPFRSPVLLVLCSAFVLLPKLRHKAPTIKKKRHRKTIKEISE